MKGALAAAAVAALAGDAAASMHGHGRRHAHLFAKRSNLTADACLPACTTIWSVVTGAPTHAWPPLSLPLLFFYTLSLKACPRGGTSC